MQLKIPMPPFREKEELYAHRDEDGTFRTFRIEAMATIADAFLGACPAIRHMKLRLEYETAQALRRTAGIEQERVDRLCPPYLDKPIIAVLWPDNIQATFVDGNHRYIKKQLLGHKNIMCHMFLYPFWEQFLLPLPADDERLTKTSGIIEHEKRNNFYDK